MAAIDLVEQHIDGCSPEVVVRDRDRREPGRAHEAMASSSNETTDTSVGIVSP
jgi:hypothetical protein